MNQNNFEVVEFRYLTVNDHCDTKYEAWSRIYEYPYVLDTLVKLNANNESTIHNSSWGFEGCHVTFKNNLDGLYKNTTHSDIKESTLTNTIVYDITQKIEEKYINFFDFVLNVSTVEEVNYPNDIVLNNLFEQVKPGGYLIVTFDYDQNICNTFGIGSMNLSCVENYLNKKIQDNHYNSNINGNNSVLPNNLFSGLNCGALVLRKKTELEI